MFKITKLAVKKYYLLKNVHTSKNPQKTHYEVLNLPRNCTQKEIRNAFLKLSKLYHPDRSTKLDSHAKYVQIIEAYKVLSKPDARFNYNLGLSNKSKPRNVHYTNVYSTNADETMFHQRNKYNESEPYYGVKGLKKVSNAWIAFFCLIIAIIGTTLQVLAIRHSFTLQRDEMERRSSELEELHGRIRSKALANGNERQIEILKKKIGYKDDK